MPPPPSFIISGPMHGKSKSSPSSVSPIGIMQKVVRHGTVIGMVEPEIRKETGLNETPVLAVGSHDTASAVAACPLTGENAAYISSGTWSLMGIESKKPIISEKAFKYNFTNEGGICDTYRVLKNISGLWLLQEYQTGRSQNPGLFLRRTQRFGQEHCLHRRGHRPGCPRFH